MSKFCGNCGAHLNDGAKFCPSCGTAVESPQQDAQQMQQTDGRNMPLQKRKSKAPFIIMGGVVVVALAAVMVFTNIFSFWDHTGDDNGGGGGSMGDIIGDSVLRDGDELGIYPAYTQIPSGYAIYLDWETKPSNKEVLWSSSDPGVATVDADGLITAITTGETTITIALKDKPDVFASCGIRVVEFLENEKALNDIVLWEDAPPSLYYQAVMYGREVSSSEAESVPEYEPGQNIPISLSVSDEELLASGMSITNAAYRGQNASIELLSASGRATHKPMKISKKVIREKLKKNFIWTIVVSGKYTWYRDDLDRTTTETFNLMATMTGGDSPFGLYGGTAEYTRVYDHSTHFAKYSDHSKCPECTQRWKHDYEGIIYKGFPPPPNTANVTSIEWMISNSYFYKGYYTSEDQPGSLFQIKKSDVAQISRTSANDLPTRGAEVIPLLFTPDDTRSWSGNDVVVQLLGEEGLVPLVPPVSEEPKELVPLVPLPKKPVDDDDVELVPLVRDTWIEFEAYMNDNFICYEDAPTNLGNNWGETRNEEATTRLKIIIYEDNLVRVNGLYFGTLTWRVE